jgi:DNA repair protein RecN (Recombination protein N)
MLDELDIRDFVLAEHVNVRFDPGFTAITGETGAGKSLIVDALSALLGERLDTDVVRTGTRAARIEGTFLLHDAGDELLELLATSGVELDENVLIVSRELPRSGRAVTRMNGRAVVQSTLVAVASRLVDIHSQTEHLAILRPAEHINYLDRYAGAVAMRTDLAAGVQDLRRIRSELAHHRVNARERARREERLEFEVAEIRAASIAPGEEEEHRRERNRLANAEQIAQLAAQAYEALEGGSDSAGATGALGEAASLLDQLAHLDESLAGEAEELEGLQSQVAAISRTLRSYSDQIEYNPELLQQIDDRLMLLASLRRKYGATLEDVARYAESAVSELQTLEASEQRIDELTAEESVLLQRLAQVATELSIRRRSAARDFCRAVDAQLVDLGLTGGRFGVSFTVREDQDGIAVELASTTVTAEEIPGASVPLTMSAIDRTGIDRIEFLISLNPGEPLRPLAQIASGGETSRLMLAVKTILGAADAVGTLVFDEIDTGVGARSGRVVGDKLATLAEHHQVICITHLPQIASLARRHLTIVKRVNGSVTTVSAHELQGDERLDEVAAMFGGLTPATRASALELLNHAASEG